MNFEEFKNLLRLLRDKYWIRRDRDDIFWSGFMLACMIASVVTTYWHYFDMIELRPKIKLKIDDSKKEIKKIKDVDLMIPLKKSSTFYKVEEYFKPE